jgi:hypothetical protein
MSYLILHLPLPDRYRGAWAAAQLKLGCKPHDADLDPGILLALLPAGVDVDALRAGLPERISCTLGDVEQQASASGAAVVINVTGEVLEVWEDLMTSGAEHLDNTPTLTLATGMYDALEAVQDMLSGQRVFFDTLDVLDLETGECVASFDLNGTEDTDDDD